VASVFSGLGSAWLKCSPKASTRSWSRFNRKDNPLRFRLAHKSPVFCAIGLVAGNI
jgi:hypothetical protein